VGLGPWGLAALERLLDVAKRRTIPTTVHVIEPSDPGSGIFGTHKADYLPLNTPCGQHVIHPTGSGTDRPSYAVTLHAWAQRMGYKWVGDRCMVSDVGEEISPHDFLPRTVMGDWLEWSYREVVAACPPFVSVVHHKAYAVDLEPCGEHESVKLANGQRVLVDHVILSTGHTPDRPQTGSDEVALSPYPVEALNDAISPGRSVAVAGLGLVALDVMAALTVGRGGSFEEIEDGRLRYRPCGSEPTMYLFSRTGLPYASKPAGASDPTGSYTPVICTPETITRLRRANDGTLLQDRLDFRRDLLPLLVAEMRIRFHRQSALILDGSLDEAERVTRVLASAWTEGRFDETVLEFVAQHGTFDFEGHLLGELSPDPDLSSDDYESRIYKLIESDVADAVTVDGRVTPVKAAFETLRILRDVLRFLIEFRGLTVGSHVEFYSLISNRMKSAVAGPPVRRSREILALMDCGIVRVPWGPSPLVEAANGCFSIRSTQLVEPHAREVDFLVRGYLPDPTIERSRSSLITHLYKRGRIRPLRYGERTIGSIDLTEDSHPVGRDGTVESRLWIFGALTEGVRYFTQYVPSPNSRVRAFQDTEECAEAIFKMVHNRINEAETELHTVLTTQAG
jgi:uncharacterized NAD(P)/FAD-binding protein YdhS